MATVTRESLFQYQKDMMKVFDSSSEDKYFFKMIEKVMFNDMTSEQVHAYKRSKATITKMTSKNGMKWTVRDYGST